MWVFISFVSLICPNVLSKGQVWFIKVKLHHLQVIEKEIKSHR